MLYLDRSIAWATFHNIVDKISGEIRRRSMQTKSSATCNRTHTCDRAHIRMVSLIGTRQYINDSEFEQSVMIRGYKSLPFRYTKYLSRKLDASARESIFSTLIVFLLKSLSATTAAAVL